MCRFCEKWKWILLLFHFYDKIEMKLIFQNYYCNREWKNLWRFYELKKYSCFLKPKMLQCNCKVENQKRKRESCFGILSRQSFWLVFVSMLFLGQTIICSLTLAMITDKWFLLITLWLSPHAFLQWDLQFWPCSLLLLLGHLSLECGYSKRYLKTARFCKGRVERRSPYFFLWVSQG